MGTGTLIEDVCGWDHNVESMIFYKDCFYHKCTIFHMHNVVNFMGRFLDIGSLAFEP